MASCSVGENFQRGLSADLYTGKYKSHDSSLTAGKARMHMKTSSLIKKQFTETSTKLIKPSLNTVSNAWCMDTWTLLEHCV